MKLCFPLICAAAVLGSWPVSAQDAPRLTYAVPVVAVKAEAPAQPPLEPSGLAEIIKAKYPLAILRKELGEGWRQLNHPQGTYFTRGDTQWLARHEYLVAYKQVPREDEELSRREFIAAVTNQAALVPRPDDRFELALLDLEALVPWMTSGTATLRSYKPPVVHDVFNPDNKPDAYYRNLSLIYLGKLSQAVNKYSQTYLNTLPPLETAFAARQALAPYAENGAVFTQPNTNKPYRANALLAGRNRAHLVGRGKMVLFYESEVAEDGSRAVLLYNGTARRVSAKEWETLRDYSQIK